ncbi:flagellar hook-associated protein 3 FlgL [Paracoccus halophilus]|uniref:Flagellar hook protein n=1 Tax=Paracoccus halophilus TaxID=376733 RepID=A0A099EZH4_9RHOB|nr:flagellin [Paracoccus halophilus]KGJ03383.1 flagellar hook protein [Paracoccus halophilus]SFA58964.1 flagellar hook-associated protein 3 FlgL [Paracoccus halophilus]
MTSYPSIGDQSRPYQLRLSQYFLKSKLERLTKEATTGIKNDIPSALKGDLSRIAHIESRLTVLNTYQQNASEALSMFDAMQNTLERIQISVDETGPSLLSEAGGSSEDMLRLRADAISEDFRSIVGALNTSSSGRHLLSGAKTDTAPLGDFETMVAELNATVAGASSANDIVARIDAWFDAPAGAGGFTDNVYQGSASGSTELAVSADRTVGSSLTANSSQLRNTLKGMAIMTYLAKSGASLDSATIRELFTVSGLRLVSASTDLTSARAQIGIQQSAASQAQARNAAESSSLSVTRLRLIGADPYETATALQEAEASIQNLYTLTARLARLSLTDYLS